MKSTIVVTLACLLSVSSLSLTGCSSGGSVPVTDAAVAAESGGSWWAVVLANVQRTSGSAIEVVHDGTGWILGKNKVEIEQIGELEEIDGKRLAEFKISVTRSDESFSANIEKIECDELGLPTEQSQEKMSEAVEKIKTMLDKLQ